MKNLILVILSVVVLGFTFGCQQAPTKSIEETSNSIFKTQTVLVDTRDAFLFQSFHIPGSVNLLTTDFLILKNPKQKKYILDPDLNQTVERLAKKGLSPDQHVILLGTKKDSVENKKWNWLLKNLGFEYIELNSLDDYNNKNKNARYAEPKRAEVWPLKLSEDLQNEFILKKAADCFINFVEKKCS